MAKLRHCVADTFEEDCFRGPGSSVSLPLHMYSCTRCMHGCTANVLLSCQRTGDYWQDVQGMVPLWHRECVCRLWVHP